MEKIKECPDNESPWLYYRGLLNHYKITEPKEFLSFCESLEPKSIFLYSFLLDYYETKDKDRALEICALLADQDKLRQKYWYHRALELQ